MKRFIRYLYEYEQGKPMRNVGFVKVEKDDEQCMVHIHGKGFHMGGRSSMEIYLIFEEEGKCVGIWQGTEENIDPAINRSFIYTREDVGTPENFEKINGIMLESRNGQRYGAIWDDGVMNLSKMERWMPKDQMQERESVEEGQGLETAGEEPQNESVDRERGNLEEEQDWRSAGEEPQKENVGRERDFAEEEQDWRSAGEEPQKESIDRKRDFAEEEPQEKGTAEEGGRGQSSGERRETGRQDDDRGDGIEVMSFLQDESLTFPDSRQREISKPQTSWKVRKIQRTELSKLARCEWHLANNNFLLHGYYNYHHLVLLESREQTLLGVPGIYHEKEGRAAAAFGFAKFVAKDDAGVKLEPEEWNEDYPFGYWCRPVKTMSRWQ